MENCENCSSLHTGEYGSGRFCSSKCARGFSTKSKRLDINDKLRKDPIEKKCLYCSDIFETKRDSIVYCSKSCGAKATTKGWCNHNAVNWSKVHKKAYASGNNFVAGGTTKWYSINTSNGIIKVQGSYELRTVKILEHWKHIRKIKDWEYSNDRFPYIDKDGKNRTYLIDFKILDNSGYWYLETKGYVQPNDLLKWDAVRTVGHTLIVWMNTDIIKEEKNIWS